MVLIVLQRSPTILVIQRFSTSSVARKDNARNPNVHVTLSGTKTAWNVKLRMGKCTEGVPPSIKLLKNLCNYDEFFKDNFPYYTDSPT